MTDEELLVREYARQLAAEERAFWDAVVLVCLEKGDTYISAINIATQSLERRRLCLAVE